MEAVSVIHCYHLFNRKAQIVDITISNLRKNLSEGNCELWQAIRNKTLIFGVLKVFAETFEKVQIGRFCKFYI